MLVILFTWTNDKTSFVNIRGIIKPGLMGLELRTYYRPDNWGQGPGASDYQGPQAERKSETGHNRCKIVIKNFIDLFWIDLNVLKTQAHRKITFDYFKPSIIYRSLNATMQ